LYKFDGANVKRPLHSTKYNRHKMCDTIHFLTFIKKKQSKPLSVLIRIQFARDMIRKKRKIVLYVSSKRRRFAYHLCLLHLNIWVKDE